jgi:hypothetical protein
MIGTCLKVSEEVDIHLITEAVSTAMQRAQLQRYNDAIDCILIFLTPHWSEHIPEVCHATLKASNCMQVFGGVAHGVFANGRLEHTKPAAAVAVIAKSLDAPKAATQLHLRLGFHDEQFSASAIEPTDHGIGLLSYAPNKKYHPRIQHGRPAHDDAVACQISAHRIKVLESVGLEPLGPWCTVTHSLGLVLEQVNAKQAIRALFGPQENSRPVGLRLAVERNGRVQWIPLVAINANGSLTLAAPVFEGERVCLAERTSTRAMNEIAGWEHDMQQSWEPDAKTLGILLGGLDRSPLCHLDDAELELIRQQWPDTPMIGAIGQAVWAQAPEFKPLTGPLNHRLTMAFIQP